MTALSSAFRKSIEAQVSARYEEYTLEEVEKLYPQEKKGWRKLKDVPDEVVKEAQDTAGYRVGDHYYRAMIEWKTFLGQMRTPVDIHSEKRWTRKFLKQRHAMRYVETSIYPAWKEYQSWPKEWTNPYGMRLGREPMPHSWFIEQDCTTAAEFNGGYYELMEGLY